MRIEEFVNVYHFLPLSSDEVKRASVLKRTEEPVYTGEIQVELKTKTPLFIPDCHGYQKGESGHKKYRFFSYDGVHPVIPGSSLRGMLRSVYEPLTNSCLSAVDLDTHVSRRTSERYEAGLLGRQSNGKITLYKASKAVILCRNISKLLENVQRELVEGSEVWVRLQEETTKQTNRKTGRQKVTALKLPEQMTEKEKKGWTRGYYFKGEPGVKKFGNSINSYVFYFQNGAPRGMADVVKSNLEGGSKELVGLQAVLSSYLEQAEKIKKTEADSPKNIHNGYVEYAAELSEFLNHGSGYFPVHYSDVDGKKRNIYLSPACITKEAYNNTPKDILEKQGKHHPCTDIRRLCPGCSLFGMVGDALEDNELDKYPNAWASKVRVQDAVTTVTGDDKLYEDELTLLELASPKLSSTEFYLQKPEAGDDVIVQSWTYDYYVTKRGKSLKVVMETPKISGRKCYWHHPKPNLPKTGVNQTERNCTVQPLKAKIPFSFSVYFERITRKQLDQLIWICNISSLGEENGEAKYGYKLGKGKPLGMGSVELRVQDVKIRSIRKNSRIGYYLDSYEKTFGSRFQEISDDCLNFEASVKEAFLRICDFQATGDMPVIYPVTMGKNGFVSINKENYKWFAYNHFHKDGSNGVLTRRNELWMKYRLIPLSADSEITFPVLEKEQRQSK